MILEILLFKMEVISKNRNQSQTQPNKRSPYLWVARKSFTIPIPIGVCLSQFMLLLQIKYKKINHFLFY